MHTPGDFAGLVRTNVDFMALKLSDHVIILALVRPLPSGQPVELAATRLLAAPQGGEVPTSLATPVPSRGPVGGQACPITVGVAADDLRNKCRPDSRETVRLSAAAPDRESERLRATVRQPQARAPAAGSAPAGIAGMPCAIWTLARKKALL